MFAPPDISDCIPREAREGALAAGRAMAGNPEGIAAAKERSERCLEAYLRELETGEPPADPPEGYAKFVRYLGEIVREEWEAERAEREAAEAAERQKRDERGECAWRVVERVCIVIAALGGIVTIAGFVMSLMAT